MFRLRSISYPPASWDVRPLEDFGAYSPPTPDTKGFHGTILLAVDPAGEATGNFQLVLTGKDAVDIKIPALDVVPHPAAMDWEVQATLRPQDALRFLPNSQATHWMDLRDLVASQDVDIINTSDGETANEAFLELLDKQKEGAIWRWFLAATSSGNETNMLLNINSQTLTTNCTLPGTNTLELRLQSLPISLAKAKQTPALMEDSAASMTVASYPVVSKSFKDGLVGPMPVLFSKDPGATLSWLKDKAKEAKMMHMLYSRLMQPEVLDNRQAVAYLANPREGHHRFPLAAAGRQPPLKKQRLADAASSMPAKEGNNFAMSLLRNTKLISKVVWLPDDLLDTAVTCIEKSISKNTWAKYASGWHCFMSFLSDTGIILQWPVRREVIRGFVVWATQYKGLKPSTVKSYLAAVTFMHTVRGFSKRPDSTDSLTDLILGGAMDLCKGSVTVSNRRRAMTLALLKFLGHKLALTSFDLITKQCYWSACVVAFFAAARMGELLSDSAVKFDKEKVMCWKDAIISSDHVALHIKKPKSKATGGEFLDLFRIENESYCPVKAILELKALQQESNVYSDNMPIFMMKNGKFLTKSVLNKFLKECFSDICIQGKDDILGHSFRMAIPTAMLKARGFSDMHGIKDWGRWISNCYLTYAKLQTGQKHALFSSVIKYL